jgi:hypothetical protein
MGKIKVTGEGAMAVGYKKLEPFQGDLKILSEEAYEKIKSSIVKFGFMEPISTWEDQGRLYILNGHQRLAAVKRMIENEKFDPVELPINIIKAKSYKDAKLRVLALTSEYGTMTQDGAVNFLADLDVSIDELEKFVNLRQVDLSDVMASVDQIKTDLVKDDAMDITNMTDESGSLDEDEDEDGKVKNDLASGLRLMQIFLAEDQVESFKEKIDAVIEHYNMENVSDCIVKCVEMVYDELQAGKESLGRDASH